MNPLYQTDLPTLGRNTDIDHHADLQVLQRLERFLLRRDFEVSQELLQRMQQGGGIAAQAADALQEGRRTVVGGVIGPMGRRVRHAVLGPGAGGRGKGIHGASVGRR